MLTVPKSQRLTLALVGRTNAGKSTLLNLIAGQDVAITSPIAGTTTDVVEKTLELLPIGPILVLDTAGFDDATALSAERRGRTLQALRRADILIAVTTAEQPQPDAALLAYALEAKKPLLTVVTQADRFPPEAALLDALRATTPYVMVVNAADPATRDGFLAGFKSAVAALCPPDFITPPPLLADLVPPGGTVLQIIPIDSQAPKGRIILPQMNVLRDALDHDFVSLVVTENGIAPALANLKTPPALAICDSQVVHLMCARVPENVPCTTYSIVMARIKGELAAFAAGAAAIEQLKDGDTVLIAESCSHHAGEEDIGRVKIPDWLRKHTGKQLDFEVVAGRDFPPDIARYALIVHCGGCMTNRAHILWRIAQAEQAGVPITNYGTCIAHTQQVLLRVLSAFPDAQAAYRAALETART